MVVTSVTVKDNTGALIADPITMNVNGAPVLGWLNGDPITVPDDTPCDVVIQATGYITYTNTFTFWTLATGDYPNMDVYLTETINPTDIKASFYAIRQPCSTNYCLYTTSSSNYSNIVWDWSDGSSTVTGFNVCRTLGIFGTLTPIQTIILEDIGTDSTTNSITVYQFIPEVSYTIQCPNEPPTPDCLNAGIGTMSITTGTCIFTVY